MSENYDALFNPQTEVETPGTSGATEEYKPSAAKGKNNVYQAVIRFIPWWKNPTKGSIQDKWTCWLVDPVTDKGRFVDCPSSVGKPSQLQDMFWKLKKSESAAMQKKAEIFSRRHSYSSLIQVIKDENNPELEGKILVWRFGVKIWEKINAELKPIVGDKHDPYDILEGKAMALVITKVSGFNNYDQTKFVEKRIPLCIPNAEGKLQPISSSTDKKKVFEWVKENSPNLEKYAYQDWDSDTQDYVNHVITAVTGKAAVSGNVASIKNNNSSGGGDVTKGLVDEGDDYNYGISSESLDVEDLGEGEDNSGDLPDLDLPDLPDSDGIGGDLDDVLKDI